jgi:catechol 2,3-dioxygenase-like lactoylglutathione lyase family enzyme
MNADHVGISVRNLEKAIDFYTNVLGMKLLTDPFPISGPFYDQILAVPNVQGRMCVVRGGTVKVELFEFTNPPPAPMDANQPVIDRGISHFGIKVDDIDAAYERLLAAGVRFHCPVLDAVGGVRATYARDLDGNVFELVQLPAHMQAKG